MFHNINALNESFQQPLGSLRKLMEEEMTETMPQEIFKISMKVQEVIKSPTDAKLQ